MAKQVLSRALKNGKVRAVIDLDYEEYLALGGRIDNIRLFSADSMDCKTNISQRGTSEATKYLLIPRKFRSNIKYTEKVGCKYLGSKEEHIFIFIVGKENI